MNYVSYIATVLSIVAFMPQTLLVIKTHKTRDISLPTFSVLVTASVLWTVYGLSIHRPPIWITNGIIGILSLVIIAFKLGVNDNK